MKVDTSNFGEMMAEFRRLPANSRLVVKAGGQEFSGEADFDVAEGVATISFATKAAPKAPSSAPPKKKK